MASAADCLARLRRAAPNLTDDDLDFVLTELQRRLDARMAAGKIEVADRALADIAETFGREIEEVALIERRNALINLRLFDDLMNFADRVDGETGDPSLAIRARLAGVNTRFEGSRSSAAAHQQALANGWMGALVARLREENLLAQVNGRDLDRQIAMELAELSKANGKPGISESGEAKRIAAIIDPIRREILARENRAGAWIKPLDGYIVRQAHHPTLLRRAGFEQWRDDIVRFGLDDERTFGGGDAETILRGMYDGLVTGDHLRPGAGDGEFRGPASLARKISAHRKIHFKDSDAWFDYNAKYGFGGVMDSVIQDINRAARGVAMMETFGPSPRAMFDRVLEALKDKHRGDVKKHRRLGERSLENQFRQLDGSVNIPVNPTSHAVAAGLMFTESLSKLGGAAISAFGDLGFKAGVLAQTGDNLFKVWGRNLESSLDGLAPGVRRQTADRIGVGLDGVMGAVASRFGSLDNTPGTMAAGYRLFFKLNLLGPWTDANKRGIGLMFAYDLAQNSRRKWANVAERDLLGLYGIDEARWEIVRRATRKEEDGRSYVMPEAVRDVPDEHFVNLVDQLTERQITRVKDEIETALRSYYVDRADEAVPTPGVRERAILRQGLQAGTPAGIAAQLIGQFKQFPVTAAVKVLGRAAQADTTAQFFRNLVNGRADLQGIVHMMVATTLLGYVAQSAKQAVKGRTPRDPTDPKTWIAAFLQGGGAGIYGDFLFGEFNRFGRSAIATAAGPTLGTGDDLLELWARFRNGEDTAASALRFATSNTPFLNLFYTRIALDYLFLYQLQEAANPGYLRRMERRIERENKQTFILPPSRAIPRGGGDRFLEGIR